MSDQKKTLNFNLSLETIPVILKRVDGTDWHCELREMSGLDRDGWMNQNRSNLTSGPNPTLKSFTDVQAKLIHLHLFDTQTNERVPLEEIRKFGASLQNALNEECIRISGLNPTVAEEEAKND